MKVRDAMTGDVLTMTPGRSLRDAAKFMADHNVGAVVIMDPEQPGPGSSPSATSYGRWARARARRRARLGAPDVHAAFADIEWDLEEAADTMAKGGFRHLVVVARASCAGSSRCATSCGCGGRAAAIAVSVSRRDLGRDRRRRVRRRRRRGDAARAPATRTSRLRARERVGGVWHHNTYPGAACDIPSHLYEFSFAPNPRLVAPLRAAGRDPGLPGGRRGERRRTDPDRTDVPPPASTTGAGCSRPARDARGRRADHRLRAALDAERAAAAGAGDFAGPAFHTARWRHDVPLAGRRVAVIGTGCSAIQVVPAIAAGRQLDVYQRSPGWTIPKLDFAYPASRAALFARFPALQRADRWPTRLPRLRCGRDDPPPLAAARLRGARAPADPRARSRTRRCAGRSRRATRSAASGSCSPTTGIRRSPATTSSSSKRPHRGDHAGRRATADGRERAADVLVLATGFKIHDFVAPMEIAGPARDARAGVGRRPARLPRRHRPRLPQPLPALRPEHQRRHRLGRRHDRGLDAPRARRAGRAAPRGRAAIEVRRDAAEAFDAGCARPCGDRLALGLHELVRRRATATTRASGRGRGRPTAAAPPAWTRTAYYGVLRAVGGPSSPRRGRARTRCRPRRRSSTGRSRCRRAPTGSRSARCRGRAGRSRGVEGGDAVLELDERLAHDLAGLAAAVGRRAVGQRLAGLVSVSRARASRSAASLSTHPAGICGVGLFEREVTGVAHARRR